MPWRRPKTARTASNPDADRPGHLTLGQRGEQVAAAHLRTLGFRVLARNLRTRQGEIDLLCRRGRLLVAVEVKTRRGHSAPERTVSDHQLQRLTTALSRVAPLQQKPPRHLRVDVVAVRVVTADTMEVLHFPGREFPAPARS